MVMKAQLYGLIGIGLGLVAFLNGLGRMRTDSGVILIFGGVFVFGCGLIAAAIAAKK